MSLYQDICNALEAKLKALAPQIDVAFENVDYEPTKGTAWMRCSHFPAPKVRIGVGIGGYNEVSGFMQVSVFYPSGAGRKAALDKVDALVQHFAVGTGLSSNGQAVLIEQAFRLPVVPEPDWYHVPVEVHWRAHDMS